MSETLLNSLLFVLWIVWALLLFGGMVIGKPDAERTRRMPRWTRMASSLTLVIAAWSYTLLHRDSLYADVMTLVAVGMTLGFLGDLFMAKLILRNDKYIFGGIGAFGLGHIAYIAAFLTLAGRLGLDASAPRWAALIVLWIIGATFWYLVVLRGAERASILHWAALPYALLLATTAGLAGGLALQDGRFAPVALGALLFLTSDLILAARLFNHAYFRWIDDWVWLTYGPAQMLIVYGVGIFLSGLG
ncbi:MAG TPA: lysoplasmalogenase [Oceanobacillus sp.]|nr:lysoplasmalogenase [Oceanobacillus sp.]